MQHRKTVLFLVTLVLLVLVIFMLYFVFFDKNLYGLSAQRNTNELQLDTIVIEVRGREFSYLKADLSLETNNKKAVKTMKQNKQYIRKIMLQIFEKEDGRELLYEQTKEQLKSKIKKEIKNSLGVDVKQVYFRNFVLAP